ncbi:MAG: bifunctional glycosyltransferase/class I SAM-dependent methyltransferase [Candidatus Moraniibacteriota bacterium]
METPLKKKPSPVINISKQVFKNKKIALFIITYNAEKHITKTMDRIPIWCRPLFEEIYLIDDSSNDKTIAVALETARKNDLKNFFLMKTPKNQGYGGNQKIGYSYAIEKGFDIVILLHGDGQYPPEYIPNIVAQYNNPLIDAVFGSRMTKPINALRGGMPIYKIIGNKILTKLENSILNTSLSEFHNGYRSYKTSALKKIPFSLNSNDFHFDTDIIIQLTIIKSKIIEISMPTHYGDEKCHVNGLKYAWNCIKSTIKARFHQAGIFFQPNFEINTNTRNYKLKKAPTSLHQYILNQPWKKDEQILDLGANDGSLSQKINLTYKSKMTAMDINVPKNIKQIDTIIFDINKNIKELFGKKLFDKIIALDIIEHLHNPEKSVSEINHLLKNKGTLYASTANIGYIIMRITLLLGWFNYGKSGILDKTHHRLFTINSFRRLLQNNDFRILKIEGFGPPLLDAFGDNIFIKTIDKICWFLAKTYPKLFAFNFLIIAEKNISLNEKIERTIATKSTFHQE